MERQVGNYSEPTDPTRNDVADRYNALAQIYLVDTDEHATTLTTLAQETVVNRFNRLVTVINISRDRKFEETSYQKLKELFDRNPNTNTRVCTATRLPNLLLFGSDTLGPDLNDSFTELIEDTANQKLFREKANRWNDTAKSMGRNVNAGDLPTANGKGYKAKK